MKTVITSASNKCCSQQTTKPSLIQLMIHWIQRQELYYFTDVCLWRLAGAVCRYLPGVTVAGEVEAAQECLFQAAASNLCVMLCLYCRPPSQGANGSGQDGSATGQQTSQQSSQSQQQQQQSQIVQW